MSTNNDLERKKARADNLKHWLNNPNNRSRNTYEVVAREWRKLENEIENEESLESIIGGCANNEDFI